MTAGERAIWAAAFTDSVRQSYEAVSRVPELCTSRIDAHVRAAVDAARTVRAARSALAKLAAMPVKEGWQAQRAEEIDMLRAMLGVTETSYREAPTMSERPSR